MADFDKKVALIEIEIDQKAALKQVDQLTLAIVQQKKTVKENTAEIKGLEKANLDLGKAVKQGTISQAEANAQIEENDKEIKGLTLTTAKQRDGLKDLNAERRQAVKESKVFSNSLDSLRIQSVKLKKELNAQETATKEGRKEFKKLAKELKGTNEKIRELDQSAGDFKTNVGNYPGIIGKAVDGFKEFSGSLTSFGDNLRLGNEGLGSMSSSLTTLPGIFATATKGMGALGTASKAFIATGIGAIIGVIALAFFSLKSAIQSNDEKMLKFQKALAPVTAMMKGLLSVLEPVADFLIEEISVALDNASKAFSSFLSALSTGLKFLGFDSAAKSVSDFSEKVSELSTAAISILDLEHSFKILKRSLTTVNATLEGQVALFQQIAGDATLSFQAQQKAAEQSIKLQERLIKKRMEESDLEESILNQKIKSAKLEGGSASDLLDQLAAVQATKIGYESEYTLFKEQNAKLQRQIAQDLWEQELDFSIDVGTKRTEEALKASENEKMSLEQRKASVEEARRLDQEAFENQIALFEEVGLTRVQINDLIKESNAQVIADELKKTQLSEIERNRFRELVIERQNNNKAIMDSDKALLDFEAEKNKETTKRTIDLNKRIREVEDKNLEIKFEKRIANASNAKEVMDIMYEQEKSNFKREKERLKEEEENLAENKEITEEERAVVQKEINLSKEEAEQSHQDKMTEIQEKADKNRLQKTQAAISEFKSAVSTGQTAVQTIIDSSSINVENRYNKRRNALKKQLAKGQITEEEYAERKEKLDQKQAIAIWKIQKKAFNVKKIFNIAGVIADTAAAVAEAVKLLPATGGLPLSAINAAIGALQISNIVKQQPPPPPTFAQGGDVFGAVVGGKPHSQGGTKYRGEDGNIFEVEKGEGLFVTKREATNPALALLDQANTSFGGSSMFSGGARFLQDGGSVATESTGFNQDDLITAIQATPPPVVQIQSIMAGINAEMEAKKVGTI